MNQISKIGVGSALLLLGGCSSIVGPRMLRNSQSEYTAAIVENEESQVLENMVRLRYCDNITSLDVASVKQTGSLDGSATFGLEKVILGKPKDGAYTGTIKPSVTPSCKNGSELSFTPLVGKDYVKKYMTQINTSALIYLTQAGWGFENVFNLVVERVNNLYNAERADGPMPEKAPSYKSFFRFSKLLGELDDAHLLNFGAKPNYNFSGLYLEILPSQKMEAKILEWKKLAGVDKNCSLLKLKDDFISDRDSSTLVIQCRTLLGVMFCLSHNIEVPKIDKEKGLVGLTKNANGTEFDWKEVCQNFTVHCSTDRSCPKDAYVACRYRERWFYILDNDRVSKSIFMLLMHLRKLQTSKYESNKPLLIIN